MYLFQYLLRKRDHFNILEGYIVLACVSETFDFHILSSQTLVIYMYLAVVDVAQLLWADVGPCCYFLCFNTSQCKPIFYFYFLLFYFNISLWFQFLKPLILFLGVLYNTMLLISFSHKKSLIFINCFLWSIITTLSSRSHKRQAICGVHFILQFSCED